MTMDNAELGPDTAVGVRRVRSAGRVIQKDWTSPRRSRRYSSVVNADISGSSKANWEDGLTAFSLLPSFAAFCGLRMLPGNYDHRV